MPMAEVTYRIFTASSGPLDLIQRIGGDDGNWRQSAKHRRPSRRWHVLSRRLVSSGQALEYFIDRQPWPHLHAYQSELEGI